MMARTMNKRIKITSDECDDVLAIKKSKSNQANAECNEANLLGPKAGSVIEVGSTSMVADTVTPVVSSDEIKNKFGGQLIQTGLLKTALIEKKTSGGKNTKIHSTFFKNNGKFMSGKDVIRMCLADLEPLDSIPPGDKTNVTLVVKYKAPEHQKGGSLVDDSGLWELSSYASVSSYFLVDGDSFERVKKKRGKFFKGTKECKREISFSDVEDNLLILRRYYCALPSYQRRVSTLAKYPSHVQLRHFVAVVEHVGEHLDQSPCHRHANEELMRENCRPDEKKLETSNLEIVNISDSVSREEVGNGKSWPGWAAGSTVPLEKIPAPLLTRNNGHFMSTEELVELFLTEMKPLACIPAGEKSNVTLLVQCKKSGLNRYKDDCSFSSHGSVTSHYLKKGDSFVYLGKLRGEISLSDNLVVIRRYYRAHKASPTYKRRISMLVKYPGLVKPLPNIAVVEYIGKHPVYYQKHKNQNKNIDAWKEPKKPTVRTAVKKQKTIQKQKAVNELKIVSPSHTVSAIEAMNAIQNDSPSHTVSAMETVNTFPKESLSHTAIAIDGNICTGHLKVLSSEESCSIGSNQVLTVQLTGSKCPAASTDYPNFKGCDPESNSTLILKNNGCFMSSEDAVRLCLTEVEPLDHIPAGVKNNMTFVIKYKKDKGKKVNTFKDRCGPWDQRSKGSVICHYQINGDSLEYVRKRNGKFVKEVNCSEQEINVSEDDILALRRYYSINRASATFKRLITSVVKWPSFMKPRQSVAVVEYVGEHPEHVGELEKEQLQNYAQKRNQIMPVGAVKDIKKQQLQTVEQQAVINQIMSVTEASNSSLWGVQLAETSSTTVALSEISTETSSTTVALTEISTETSSTVALTEISTETSSTTVALTEISTETSSTTVALTEISTETSSTTVALTEISNQVCTWQPTEMRNCGRFMSTQELVRLCQAQVEPLPYIPLGKKNNMTFLVRSERKVKLNDDCGHWERGSKGAPTSHYQINGDSLEYVRKRNGKFIKTVNSRKHELNVSENDILVLQRHYSTLRALPTFKRRIACVVKWPSSMKPRQSIAVVEYVGEYPEHVGEDEEEHSRNYVQTRHQIMAVEDFKKQQVQTAEQQAAVNQRINVMEASNSSLLSGQFKEMRSPSVALTEISNQVCTGQPTEMRNCGRFMSAQESVRLCLGQVEPLDNIPLGEKNNMTFLVRDQKKGRFHDDCGPWKSYSIGSVCSHFLMEGDSLKYLRKYKGKFFKTTGSKKIEINVSQFQDNILVLRRFYRVLEAFPSCRRRISVLVKYPGSVKPLPNIAVVEYIGKHPEKCLQQGHQNILGEKPIQKQRVKMAKKKPKLKKKQRSVTNKKPTFKKKERAVTNKKPTLTKKERLVKQRVSDSQAAALATDVENCSGHGQLTVKGSCGLASAEISHRPSMCQATNMSSAITQSTIISNLFLDQLTEIKWPTVCFPDINNSLNRQVIELGSPIESSVDRFNMLTVPSSETALPTTAIERNFLDTSAKSSSPTIFSTATKKYITGQSRKDILTYPYVNEINYGLTNKPIRNISTAAKTNFPGKSIISSSPALCPASITSSFIAKVTQKASHACSTVKTSVNVVPTKNSSSAICCTSKNIINVMPTKNSSSVVCSTSKNTITVVPLKNSSSASRSTSKNSISAAQTTSKNILTVMPTKNSSSAICSTSKNIITVMPTKNSSSVACSISKNTITVMPSKNSSSASCSTSKNRISAAQTTSKNILTVMPTKNSSSAISSTSKNIITVMPTKNSSSAIRSTSKNIIAVMPKNNSSSVACSTSKNSNTVMPTKMCFPAKCSTITNSFTVIPTNISNPAERLTITNNFTVMPTNISNPVESSTITNGFTVMPTDISYPAESSTETNSFSWQHSETSSPTFDSTEINNSTSSKKCTATNSASIIKNNGKFLSPKDVVRLCLTQVRPLDSIPTGEKRDVTFLVRYKKSGHQKAGKLPDDCGLWEPYLYGSACFQFLVKDSLEHVQKWKQKFVRGVRSSKREISLSDAQHNLIVMRRYYCALKGMPSFKRRVSVIVKRPGSVKLQQSVAVVEYVGAHPGCLSNQTTQSRLVAVAKYIQRKKVHSLEIPEIKKEQTERLKMANVSKVHKKKRKEISNKNILSGCLTEISSHLICATDSSSSQRTGQNTRTNEVIVSSANINKEFILTGQLGEINSQPVRLTETDSFVDGLSESVQRIQI